MSDYERGYADGREAAAKVADLKVQAAKWHISAERGSAYYLGERAAAAYIATDIRALPVPQGGEATEPDWAERYRLVCFELCERMGVKPDEIIADSGEEAWMLVGYEARTKQAAALRARSQP